MILNQQSYVKDKSKVHQTVQRPHTITILKQQQLLTNTKLPINTRLYIDFAKVEDSHINFMMPFVQLIGTSVAVGRCLEEVVVE